MRSFLWACSTKQRLFSEWESSIPRTTTPFVWQCHCSSLSRDGNCKDMKCGHSPVNSTRYPLKELLLSTTTGGLSSLCLNQAGSWSCCVILPSGQEVSGNSASLMPQCLWYHWCCHASWVWTQADSGWSHWAFLRGCTEKHVAEIWIYEMLWVRSLTLTSLCLPLFSTYAKKPESLIMKSKEEKHSKCHFQCHWHGLSQVPWDFQPIPFVESIPKRGCWERQHEMKLRQEVLKNLFGGVLKGSVTATV